MVTYRFNPGLPTPPGDFAADGCVNTSPFRLTSNHTFVPCLAKKVEVMSMAFDCIKRVSNWQKKSRTFEGGIKGGLPNMNTNCPVQKMFQNLGAHIGVHRFGLDFLCGE